jgi:hypothetical protein
MAKRNSNALTSVPRVTEAVPVSKRYLETLSNKIRELKAVTDVMCCACDNGGEGMLDGTLRNAMFHMLNQITELETLHEQGYQDGLDARQAARGAGVANV